MVLRGRVDPLSPCLDGPLQFPGPIETLRAGRRKNSSPGRCKRLLAILKIVRASLRPCRHRHGNGDGPFPCTCKPSDTANLVAVVAKDKIVLDTGPGRSGIERDCFFHGNTDEMG